MTGIRPDGLDGWLSSYFNGLQVPGISPDATAVRRQNDTQAPPQGTIGPAAQGNIPLPLGHAQPLNPESSALIDNLLPWLKAPEKLQNIGRAGYNAAAAIHDRQPGLAAGAMIGALGEGASLMGPEGEGEKVAAEAAAPKASYLNLLKEWQPTSRGIFDRSAPNIQGQVASDARLVVPKPKTDRMSTSPLVDAIYHSRTVQKGLDADVDKGLLMGGPSWYELGPIKADLDSRAGTGAMSFSDFNNLGGGSSASNSVPGELSAMSVANYARLHGLTRQEAVQHFLDQTGSRLKPSFMDMHYNLGMGGIRDGTILPDNPMSESWKIPSYVDKRNGGGGLLDVEAPGGMPALDTHERRRVMQLAMENPRLAKIARQTGADAAAESNKGTLPLRNALDYKAIADLYTDGARRYGMPTSGAYQASRWTGGWDKTGLKTAPTGDFVQLLEDAIKYSAQMRGMDDSPAGLRNYWSRVAEGKDFIMPYFGKGYYPIK